jgi:hypothetical protein
MSRAGNVFAVLNTTNGNWADKTLWRSDGEGKTWVKCLLNNNFGAGVPSMPECLLAAGGYLFMDFGAGKALGRSADGGDNWTSCSPSGTANWYSMAAQPGGSRICVGVNNGTVWFSSDYGNTWTSVQVPNWGYQPCGPLYWPYNDRLYLLADNYSGPNGICTSTDGATWTLLRYRATVTFGGSTYQLLSLFFPPDPTKPPWAVADGPLLLRGQMVNGSWNGCFDGEVWVDPSSGNNPSGTATNYVPSGFASSSIPWLIFHDDRMIVFGRSSLTPQPIPTNWVSTSDDTIIAYASDYSWVTGTKVRYRTAGGAALAPLVDGQDYYVIVVDSSHIKLATTQANAQAGIAIDLTSTGNSSQTLGVAQAGIATTPIAYAAAGTPVWTYPEVDCGLDFEMAWMDPNNHSYIWASAASADGSSRNIGGIWRSLDGGQTWSPSNAGAEQCNLVTNCYGRPLLVSANTPHDSVPVKPTAPVITAVTDLDPTTFTGLTVTYTPGQAALRHDLYMDGVLAVSSYASGATYHPPDRQSHSYIVRAVNDAGYTDSNAMSGADLSVPAITSIDDLSPCAQTGIHINYLGDPAALRHDLVKDGSVVVTGYVSGALYNPADTVSHTYIIRAVYSSSTADSNSVAFSDANNTPGKPVVTVADLDPYVISGVQVSWSAVAGATSYDLYVDGVQAVIGATSPLVYEPTTSYVTPCGEYHQGLVGPHSYVVRAYHDVCYTDSDPVVATDAGVQPTALKDGDHGHLMLSLDLASKAWYIQQDLRCASIAWDTDNQCMMGAGEHSAGWIYTRGCPIPITLGAGSKALKDLGRVRAHALEVDLTSDKNDLTCTFIIDGGKLLSHTLTTPIRGTVITPPDASGVIPSSQALRHTLRFACPQGGLGIIVGFKIEGTVQGEFKIHSFRFLYA